MFVFRKKSMIIEGVLMNRKADARIRLRNDIIDTEIGVRVSMDESSTSNFHSHEFIEIFYCLEGSAKQKIDDEEETIKPGDVFIFNSGVFHKFYDIKGTFQIVNVMFLSRLLFDVPSKNFIEEYFIKEFGALKTEFFEKVKYLKIVEKESRINYNIHFFNMLTEYKYIKNISVKILRKELELLLLNIGRDYLCKDQLLQFSMENKKTIQSVVDHINENVCQINKVEDLVKEIPYNLSYFNRIFKRYMGISVSKYIKKKKIDYSCFLLRDTDMSIEQVAETIGYYDLKNFYRMFKSLIKETPSEYRKKTVKK